MALIILGGPIDPEYADEYENLDPGDKIARTEKDIFDYHKDGPQDYNPDRDRDLAMFRLGQRCFEKDAQTNPNLN